MNDPVNTYDLNGQWSVFGFIQNIARTVIRAVVRVVVATVKAVVKTVARVAATVSHVARKVVSYGQKVVAYVAPMVASVGSAIEKAASKTYTAVRDADRATVSFAAKHGDWISMSATVLSIGVCAATAGIGCAVTAAAAVAIGAGAAAAESYQKHGDIRRAGFQAIGAVATDAMMGFGLGSMARMVGAGRIGEAAVDLHGAPASFLGGMGVEALIDNACDKSQGAVC